MGAPKKTEGVPAPVESEIPTAPVDVAPPAPPKSSAPPAGRYVVAAGRYITCAVGVLGPGAAVRLRDIAGGADAFDLLVRKGYLIAG